MKSSTSLAHALWFLLGRSSPPSSDFRIFDYGDEVVFADLWQAKLAAKTHHGIKFLILCGINPPDSAFPFLQLPGMPQVEMGQHFSAYSWAAAFRLLNPETSLRIVIIECEAHSHIQGVGDDLRKVFGNVAAGLGVIGLRFPGLAEILNGIQQPPSRELSTGEKGMLRGIIQQHLLPNAEEHHNMGNILGALMLSPHLREEVQMLGSLFQALEPDTSFAGQFNLPPVDAQLAVRMAAGPATILFDDMGEVWAAFVRRWIPEGRLHIPPVNAECRQKLAEKLKALAAEPVQLRRLNASDFGVTDVPDGEPFILLLDLRLFGGDQRDEEVHFVDELKEVAERVLKASHLKWPAIGELEMTEGVKAWYAEQTFSPTFRKTRSWLPRLISLVDPTLPIMVFSSTQDPEVLRDFRHYGNIISDFAKPMFRGALGEAKEWAGSAALAFEKALDSALKISAAQSRTRAICWAFEKNGNDGAETNAAEAVAPTPALVEIFLDESGTPDQRRFAVGAVVLIAGGTAFDHAIFREEQRNHGLWGVDDIHHYEFNTLFPDESLRFPKGERLFEEPYDELWVEKRLAQIKDLVGRQGANLLACSLRSDQAPDLNNVASPMHPFHRYRTVIGRLLEAILLHCQPVRLALETGASIAIDAATAGHSAWNWNCRDIRERFGPHVFGPDRDLMCMTFSNDDLLPVLKDVLVRNARVDQWGANLERARATKLLDWDKCMRDGIAGGGPDEWKKELHPKPLHYLADWIAHISRSDQDWERVPRIPTLKGFFEKGFMQEDEAIFRSQLRSHRHWSQAARNDAIRCWKQAEAHVAFSLIPNMSRNAAKWMEDLSAADLITLFHSERSAKNKDRA